VYPASFAYLGWIAGIICWVIGILFAYYTSYAIAEVVHELSERAGRRIVRYRDICRMVWGKLK
jgi:amino acid permease